MTVHLTPAQARKLGITPPAGKRRTRTATTNCLPLRCCTCGEVFTRPVDENRHFDTNPTHRRYEAVLT